MTLKDSKPIVKLFFLNMVWFSMIFKKDQYVKIIRRLISSREELLLSQNVSYTSYNTKLSLSEHKTWTSIQES